MVKELVTNSQNFLLFREKKTSVKTLTDDWEKGQNETKVFQAVIGVKYSSGSLSSRQNKLGFNKHELQNSHFRRSATESIRLHLHGFTYTAVFSRWSREHSVGRQGSQQHFQKLNNKAHLVTLGT